MSRKLSVRGVPFECAEAGAEFLAAKVGQRLRLDVPEIELVSFEDRVCCLSWNFVDLSYQLREGTDLTNVNPDDKKRFSLNEIRDVLSRHLDWRDASEKLTHLVCFDILIGNRDRHQGNWGVLVSAERGEPVRMAPFYDNGSAFGSNFDPSKVRAYLTDENARRKFDSGFEYEMTVRPGIKGRIDELLGTLLDWHPQLYSFIERLEALTEDAVEAALHSIPESALSQDRKEFAYTLLLRRRTIIRERVAIYGA